MLIFKRYLAAANAQQIHAAFKYTCDGLENQIDGMPAGSWECVIGQQAAAVPAAAYSGKIDRCGAAGKQIQNLG